MTERYEGQGGQAFPGPAFTRTSHPNGHDMGMTLRDWFAGQALAGITAGYWSNPNMGGLTPQTMADEAYQHADAMIAARKGGAA